MKHFFALPALLRTAAILAAASQHTFSVGDDILAFPQYEVQFAEEWIAEADARPDRLSSDELHVRHASGKESMRDAPPSQVEQYSPQDARGGEDGEEELEYEYAMTQDGHRWLCSLPRIQARGEANEVNETQSQAEEERELARATDRGWELLSGMQGHCVYFISGWWSYRFCYNQGVKQFHQLPPSRGVPAYPPVEDPGVSPFMLGTYDEKRVDAEDEAVHEDKWEGDSALDVKEGIKRRRTGSGELVQRGETRYLVQRLGGGDVCDLTGKARRVEVQFHCNPQTTDRISLIKEMSTCAYLMVIQTPRLCNDVAFLPPQKDHPNPISCRPILADDEIEEYEANLQALKEAEKEASIWEATVEAGEAIEGEEFELPLQFAGDIWVGGHQIVPEGVKIEKSAIVGGGKETYIETVASSDGKALNRDDLKKLGVNDAKDVEKLKKELEKIAGGKNWKLDVIETPQGREYRGIIGDDRPQEGEDQIRQKTDEQSRDGPDDGKQQESEEGSEEEYYREEL